MILVVKRGLSTPDQGTFSMFVLGQDFYLVIIRMDTDSQDPDQINQRMQGDQIVKLQLGAKR